MKNFFGNTETYKVIVSRQFIRLINVKFIANQTDKLQCLVSILYF